MKHNAMRYGIIGKSLLIIMLPVLLASCFWRSSVEVVIADGKTILTENPLIIKCKKPFYRSRDSAAIHFSTIQRCFLAWENNRGGMDLNGRKVFLIVTLIDSNGNSYTNNSGGMAGDSFAVSFSNLSTKTKIVEIRIASSADFYCSKIVWYCFDPV